jgi:hypothetical protein
LNKDRLAELLLIGKPVKTVNKVFSFHHSARHKFGAETRESWGVITALRQQRRDFKIAVTR